MGDFYERSRAWEDTPKGRVEQGIREMAVRLGRNITQADVAGELGVSGSALSQWLSGSRQATRENLEKLAKLFQRAGLSRYTRHYIEAGIREKPRPMPPPVKIEVPGKRGK